MVGRYVADRMRSTGADHVFDGCRDELRASDVAFGNLECVLSTAPFATRNRFRLRGDSAFAVALRSAGFSVMSIANNHAADCGAVGVEDTIRWLTRAGIFPVGRDNSAHIVNIRGVRVAFLAYCDFPETLGGLLSATNSKTLKTDIETACQLADATIVSWHWGEEGTSVPTARQRSLARMAANFGASAVIGHHPHVLQPIETLRRPDGGKCVVAYSLGNFVFDAKPMDQRRTGILHLRVTSRGVESYHLTPYVIGRPSFQPHKVSKS